MRHRSPSYDRSQSRRYRKRMLELLSASEGDTLLVEAIDKLRAERIPMREALVKINRMFIFPLRPKTTGE